MAYTWLPEQNCATELLAFSQIRLVKWKAKNKFFIINEDKLDVIGGKNRNSVPQFKIEIKKER